MAAVMALILIPVVAAVGLMLLINIDNLSLSTAMGTLVFMALAIGVFASLFKMARRWENARCPGSELHRCRHRSPVGDVVLRDHARIGPHRGVDRIDARLDGEERALRRDRSANRGARGGRAGCGPWQS